MENILIKIKDLIYRKKKILLIPLMIVFVLSGVLIIIGDQSGIMPFIYSVF